MPWETLEKVVIFHLQIRTTNRNLHNAAQNIKAYCFVHTKIWYKCGFILELSKVVMLKQNVLSPINIMLHFLLAFFFFLKFCG